MRTNNIITFKSAESRYDNMLPPSFYDDEEYEDDDEVSNDNIDSEEDN